MTFLMRFRKKFNACVCVKESKFLNRVIFYFQNNVDNSVEV